MSRVLSKLRSPGHAARQLVLLSGIAVASTLVACSVDGAAVGGQSDEVRIAIPNEPPNWDYVNNPSSAIKQVLMFNVVEPLIEKQPDNKYTPLLAQSYDVSPDGKAYTFHLREATFHNGKALSADDVVYSLQTNQKSTQGDVAAPFAAVTAIEKVDDLTVRVSLSRPSQAFQSGMSGPSGLIIPAGTAKELATHPVGTGPFTFGTQRPNVDVTLTSHPDYWGKKPYFKTAVFKFVSDETSSVNSLLAHDIDFVTPIVGVGLERVGTISKQPGFAAHLPPPTQVNYISLNAADKVFADERVRQAIAYAVNRKDVITGALADLSPETCVYDLPESGKWSPSECPYPYDPDKARQLLAAAGANGLTLNFVYLNGQSYPAAQQILAQQLGQVGIKVSAKGVDLATYIDQVITKKDYQITQITGPQFADSWKCPSAFISGDCYEPYDQQLATADEAVSISDWSKLRHQAILMLSQRAYTIPLAGMREIGLYRGDLAGLKESAYYSEVDLRGMHWK